MKKTILSTLLLGIFFLSAQAAEIASTAVYSVAEISFAGPSQTQNNPSLDFWVTFTHESGSPSYKIWGFFDGNGTGGNSGNIFKVRFCPTVAGKWNITDTYSTDASLNNQKEGDYITGTASSNHGFWSVEATTGGGRWYKRSDGSHQYFFGNTHYDFLDARSTAGVIADINGNADYFKKLRFSVDGTHAVSPDVLPAGTYPNNSLYYEKSDLAIRTALSKDLITDLIMNKVPFKTYGEAYVKYIAARYGSYPNVWFCLANEWDIKDALTTTQAKDMGQQLRKYIPYGNPLSIHPNAATGWNTSLNTTPAWNDHKIIQEKIKDLSDAAAKIATNYSRTPTGMPVINDENAYEGPYDGFSEGDAIEGLFGTFAGGGYASTGFKNAKGTSQYYIGTFDANEHTSADNLKWLADAITANIEFWKLTPVANASSIFPAASAEYKVLQETGKQHLLCTDASGTVSVNLPTGTWNLKQIDAIAKTVTSISNLSGTYSLAVPNSRACINYFYLANSLPNPIITAPLATATFSPGESVSATATGINLSWSISIVGGSTFTTGSGTNINFQIPTNTANNAQIKIELTGGTNSNEIVSQLNTIIDDSPAIEAIAETAIANTAFSIQLTATGTGIPMNWSSTLLPAGTTLSSNGLLQGTLTSSGNKSLTVTVTDVDGDSDTKTLTLVVEDASLPFCEMGGMVTVECENTTSLNINGDIIGWEKSTTTSGYAGSGYMTTAINGYANGIWTEAADLSYDISFNTTGTYSLWIYRNAPSASSNSANIGINGTQIGTSFDNGSTYGWGWLKHATTISITSIGVQTLNIRRREQGFIVDKFILTTNTAFTPTGNAQAESPKCTTEVQSTTQQNQISVYPNPFTNTISVTGISDGNLEVFTATGSKIKSIRLTQNTSEIDLSELNKGLYVIKIQNESNVLKSFKINKL